KIFSTSTFNWISLPLLLSCRREPRLQGNGVRKGNGKDAMPTGTVKWFNDSKGFGFISQDGGGDDVFCHHTAINMDGFRTLAEGQKVEFELAKGPKGLQAQNVRAA